MEDFRALALTWDSLPGDTALPVTTAPSRSDLNERQMLRVGGDQALLEQLTRALSPPPGETPAPPSQPVPIAENSLLGQWAAVFSKAINSKDFIAWANVQGFDLQTLRLHNSTLSVTARHQAKVFTLADTSDWWALANPIIYIGQLLDPLGLGMPYIAPTTDDQPLTLPLELALAFHGLPMPVNRLQRHTLVEELHALGDFPGFDDNARSRSVIYTEIREQQRDREQLADVLDAIARDEDSIPDLEPYRQRLVLASDSRLATDINDAASLLKAVMDDNALGSTTATPTSAYFDIRRQLICIPAFDEGYALTTVEPENLDTRWYRLGVLGTLIGANIHLDHSLSVADALRAYELQRPHSAAQISALAQRLRQSVPPPAPVVLNDARSFKEVYYFRQYVGLLNDRHELHSALSKAIATGSLQGRGGLGMFIDSDPDALQSTVKKANAHLRALTDDPAFLAIRKRERIAPTSHVMLTASGSVGAIGLDGQWKVLTHAVMVHERLAPLVRQLRLLAAKTGGQLRTNDTVTLAQALKLYQLGVPKTLEDALLSLRRLAITLPSPASQGHYWRALKPLAGAQPSAWALSTLQREHIVTLTDQFLQSLSVPLFQHLGDVALAGKSVAEVRAEADFLMVRVLASAPAQQLGHILSTSLHWHDSPADDATQGNRRNALILAALILSVDAQPQAYPTRLRHIDWQDAYYWGESVSFVRGQLEQSLSDLDAPAAALATHLFLCEKSPHLLVRGIPESTPCLSSQAWVLFRQYVTFVEKVIPGSSRQLTYTQIMYLAYLKPEGHWKTFLDSPEAMAPILDWAVANGVLAPRTHYDAPAINTALAALNGQRARLASTLEAFNKPIVTLRQTALNDLRRVYPDNPLLEAKVLMWLPPNSPFSEDGRFDGVHTGPKYSFVDLHMAASLDVTATSWHSTDSAIKYQQMAKRFHFLGQINSVFTDAFRQKVDELRAAYAESILYWLSHLTLPRRVALEYGEVQFFRLSQHSTEPTPHTEIGRFGLLVYVAYGINRDFYEFFPKQVLIRPRRDLEYQQVMQAVDTATAQAWMRFDWPAYASGTLPAPIAATGASPHLLISRLDRNLPEAPRLPVLDALGRNVPRTFDSARSRALTETVLEHLLHDSVALRENATLPITLHAAVSGSDPWADYLQRVALVHF